MVECFPLAMNRGILFLCEVLVEVAVHKIAASHCCRLLDHLGAFNHGLAFRRAFQTDPTLRLTPPAVLLSSQV